MRAPARRRQDPPVPDDCWRDDRLCRNCGSALAAPYCGQCGQKQARRLGYGDLGRETWLKWRLFELGVLRTARELLTGPGRVAREYVLGRRATHVHPLKLLLVAVGVLVLMLGRANYLQSADTTASEALALVRSYGKWSFTLTIAAIVGASLAVFRRRLGYNAVEHLVMGAYAHALVIALNIVNLLPTLFWTSPAFLQSHKAATAVYLYAVKAIVVAVAYRQFFLLDLRRDWPRLLAAVTLFLVLNWLLTRGYAMLIVELVLRQAA